MDKSAEPLSGFDCTFVFWVWVYVIRLFRFLSFTLSSQMAICNKCNLIECMVKNGWDWDYVLKRYRWYANAIGANDCYKTLSIHRKFKVIVRVLIDLMPKLGCTFSLYCIDLVSFWYGKYIQSEIFRFKKLKYFVKFQNQFIFM